MSELSRLYEPLINEILSYCDTNCLLNMLHVNHVFYNYVKNLKNNNGLVTSDINKWLTIFPKSKKIYTIGNIIYYIILEEQDFKHNNNIEEITITDICGLELKNFVFKFPNLKKLTFIGMKKSTFDYYKTRFLLLYNIDIDIRLK